MDIDFIEYVKCDNDELTSVTKALSNAGQMNPTFDESNDEKNYAIVELMPF